MSNDTSIAPALLRRKSTGEVYTAREWAEILSPWCEHCGKLCAEMIRRFSTKARRSPEFDKVAA